MIDGDLIVCIFLIIMLIAFGIWGIYFMWKG